MKVLGADIGRSDARPAIHTIVALDADGAIVHSEQPASLPELAAAVGRLAEGEPFLLGIDIPVVVPAKLAKARPVESLVRRRFGVKLPPGGRATLTAAPGGVASEALMAGLAAAGEPCLPYPDRDRRRSGVAETYPGLILKALMWESGGLGSQSTDEERQAMFRGYSPPLYRAAQLPSRTGWMEQLARLDQTVRAVRPHPDVDVSEARRAIEVADDADGVELAASLLDAALIAGMARRYLEAPESCLYAGDREAGYVILPADPFIRSLGSDTRPTAQRLFPTASLRDQLGVGVRLRPVDLITMPGQPQRLEAAFRELPGYEFDNLDEMLWWKHTRHVRGPLLPTDGLCEMTVALGDGSEEDGLRLVRSRHRTLSYRFEPPIGWRRRLATRDGKTYAFRVVRAVYETAPGD